MNRKNSNLPFKILVSFDKLFQSYEALLNSENKYVRERAERIMDIANKYPILRDGFDDVTLLDTYKDPIDAILRDLFTPTLSSNEIKVATTPLQDKVFYTSERFDKIIEQAGETFHLEIKTLMDDEKFMFACCAILKTVYGVELDKGRPSYYDIPDAKGIMRHYRLAYNGDFIDIQPTEKARELTKEDITELLDNFGNIEVWKHYFPDESYVCKGFVISNIFDVTLDSSISELKTNLLAVDKNNKLFLHNFTEIFKSMFGIPDIQLGFSIFNKEDQAFEKIPYDGVFSFLMCSESNLDCRAALCDEAYDDILVNNKYFTVSDITSVYKSSPKSEPYKSFYEAGMRSSILAPISNGKELLGLLELGSPRPYELNSIVANRLDDVIPYLVVTIMRSKAEEKNRIEAIIQQECTSIHSSVFWKFEKEAKRFLKESMANKQATFREVVFENVHPLYGQIDVRDSSAARNQTTKKDLLIQLNLISDVFDKVAKEASLPIYDEIKFRIKSYLNQVKTEYQNNSEQLILDFLQDEINPVLNHLKKEDDQMKELVNKYYESLNENGIVYKYRKDYDNAIGIINKTMAGIIDEKQEEAQKMFPHYFERYKTDGVEHTMYIGSSIAKDRQFSELYLGNLRLWQLQVMCEMENEFYQLLPDLPFKLKAASLILVHNATLSIRFRMDEHKFDVDGTYNARYEIIKKRLDKAFIANTKERVTQEGKIAIVYASKKEEQEYLRYIKLLQVQKYISDNVEMIELEALQGVSGLKAIRVEVLYTSKDHMNEYFTLDKLPALKAAKLKVES
ncbi:hypothetical protein SAMN05216480_101432 [Pustulibacterium marinum]|uniref:GAF domain-containing protein n=1 Tax=Pustulibacterium marinum TaxID=1224947 RepID=A0A1I7EYL1_9FLAO|nr:GAF domain-containing protein [Pustulibacterium marinum]SFU29028.1 hypothetical protein SAMN05216480_101432 [Pustulibacterium marinum]